MMNILGSVRQGKQTVPDRGPGPKIRDCDCRASEELAYAATGPDFGTRRATGSMQVRLSACLLGSGYQVEPAATNEGKYREDEAQFASYSDAETTKYN